MHFVNNTVVVLAINSVDMAKQKNYNDYNYAQGFIEKGMVIACYYS